MKFKYLFTLLWLLFILFINKTAAQKTVSSPALEADMQRASLLMPWDNADMHIKKNIFVRIITSKKTCYVGDPLLVTYKLFTRLQSHSKIVDAPTFTGCSVIEMTTSDLKQEMEIVNGKLFKTFTIRKVQLVPLQEGVLSLGEVLVDNEVVLYQVTNGNYNNLKKQIRLTNGSVAIKVIPLPADTSKKIIGGGIGKFFMTGKVAKLIDTANDNNSLEITITGSGNFMNITCPLVQWPAGIQAYEPKVSEMLDKLAFPVLGEKKFIIPFTCKQQGELIIPAINFTYFDADAGKYVSAIVKPIQIKVLPAVPLIDSDKLTVGVDNVKYLWIIPGIAAIVGLVMMYYSTKKKRITIESKLDRNDKKDKVLEESKMLHIEKLTALQLIVNDNCFYIDAKALAFNLQQDAIEDEVLSVIGEVILLCNEALYAHKEVDKEQIIAALRQGVQAL